MANLVSSYNQISSAVADTASLGPPPPASDGRQVRGRSSLRHHQKCQSYLTSTGASDIFGNSTIQYKAMQCNILFMECYVFCTFSLYVQTLLFLFFIFYAVLRFTRSLKIGTREESVVSRVVDKCSKHSIRRLSLPQGGLTCLSQCGGWRGEGGHVPSPLETVRSSCKLVYKEIKTYIILYIYRRYVYSISIILSTHSIYIFKDP